MKAVLFTKILHQKGDYKMNSNIEISYGLGDNKSLKRGTHYRAERERERERRRKRKVCIIFLSFATYRG